MSTPPRPAAPPAPGFRFNPRVVGILAALLVFICVVVVLTDHFSPRKRTLDEPAAAPATTRAA